jgi:hypothetical protein
MAVRKVSVEEALRTITAANVRDARVDTEIDERLEKAGADRCRKRKAARDRAAGLPVLRGDLLLRPVACCTRRALIRSVRCGPGPA